MLFLAVVPCVYLMSGGDAGTRSASGGPLVAIPCFQELLSGSGGMNTHRTTASAMDDEVVIIRPRESIGQSFA
ncbi:hypothetical protein BS78_04G286300 [Paspalum vaginatum]|nr:hypothetical protein BS78_04G286300 [Paspalum vaginatum]